MARAGRTDALGGRSRRHDGRCRGKPVVLLMLLLGAAVATMTVVVVELCKAATTRRSGASPLLRYSPLRTQQGSASSAQEKRYFVLSPCGISRGVTGLRRSAVIKGLQPNFRYMPCGMQCSRDEVPSEVPANCIEAANAEMTGREDTHKFVIQAPHNALQAVVASILKRSFRMEVAGLLVNCLPPTDIESHSHCRGRVGVTLNPSVEDKYRRRKLLLLSQPAETTTTTVVSPSRIPLPTGVRIKDRAGNSLVITMGLEQDLWFNGHIVSLLERGESVKALAAGGDYEGANFSPLAMPLTIENLRSEPFLLSVERDFLNRLQYNAKSPVTLSFLEQDILMPFDDSAPIKKKTYNLFVKLLPHVPWLANFINDSTPLQKQNRLLYISCWTGDNQQRLEGCAQDFLGEKVVEQSGGQRLVSSLKPEERGVYVGGGSVKTIELFVAELHKKAVDGNIIIPQHFLLAKPEPDEGQTDFYDDYVKKQNAKSSWAFYNDYKAIEGAGFFKVGALPCYLGLVVRYDAKNWVFKYEQETGAFANWIEAQSGKVEVRFSLAGVSVRLGWGRHSTEFYKGARPEANSFVLLPKAASSDAKALQATATCEVPNIQTVIKSTGEQFFRQQVTVKVNHTAFYRMLSATTPIRVN